MMYVKIMLRLDFHLLGLSVSVRTMLTCGHLRPWLNIHRVEKNTRQRSARQARFSPLGSYTHCVCCLRVRSPGGRRASGGSDSIAASLSVKEKNVWLCLFCLVFRGRHHASGLLLLFSLLPFTDAHTSDVSMWPSQHKQDLINISPNWVARRGHYGFNENLFPFTEHLQHVQAQRRSLGFRGRFGSSSIAADSLVFFQCSRMFPPQQNFVERQSETGGRPRSRVTHRLTSECVSHTLPSDWCTYLCVDSIHLLKVWTRRLPPKQRRN